jgi:hypothetical protein
MNDQGMEQQVADIVTAMSGEMIGVLGDLVRVPSVVGNEQKAQEFMAGLFRTLDLADAKPWEMITISRESAGCRVPKSRSPQTLLIPEISKDPSAISEL